MSGAPVASSTPDPGSEVTDQHVMTVLGPISVGELGPTITHEHVLIDMTCYVKPASEVTRRTFTESAVELSNLGLLRRDPLQNRDNCRLSDLDLAVEELLEFRKLGGGTIVDVTLPDIGRDPLALQMASRMSGLNIVAGCGHYVHLAHPATLDHESVESIAGRLIAELTVGIGTTGVRPGIIGEIGTSDPLHPREEKVLRAAARAQQATGVAISLHLHPGARTGHHMLDILESEGADPRRTVMGHLDNALGHLDIGFEEAVEYHRSLARRECYIQFDCCGVEMYCSGLADGRPFWLPSDRDRARAVARLMEDGFGQQILLSQDVCKKIDLMHYGGFGYGHILRNFVHNLRDYGLADAEFERLLIHNPRRMLALAS